MLMMMGRVDVEGGISDAWGISPILSEDTLVSFGLGRREDVEGAEEDLLLSTIGLCARRGDEDFFAGPWAFACSCVRHEGEGERWWLLRRRGDEARETDSVGEGDATEDAPEGLRLWTGTYSRADEGLLLDASASAAAWAEREEAGRMISRGLDMARRCWCSR